MGELARCYTKAGRTREAIDLLEKCGPNMCDDTWVNFLLANLQVWNGELEGYNATRRWMIDWIVKSGNGGRFVDRTAWMCCIAPLENEEQGRILLKKLKWVQAGREKPGAGPDTSIRADSQSAVRGLACYRTGDYASALEQFEKTRILGAVRNNDPDLSYAASTHWALFYKALTLHRLGRENEAKALYAEATKSLKPEPLQDKPLLNTTSSDGTMLLVWIAHREAKKIFEPASTQ